VMIYLMMLLVLIVLLGLLLWYRRGRKANVQEFPIRKPDEAMKQEEDELLPNDSELATIGESEELDLSLTQQSRAEYVILIVDDQAAIRMLLREVFELEGFQVYDAPHGRTAIEQAKRYSPDFVLLDLKMPDMDGIEVLRAIRQFAPNVHVAMITAYGDPDKLEAARSLGMLASFTKPFDIEVLRKFVSHTLQGK